MNHRLVKTAVILAIWLVHPAACDPHHVLTVLPQDAAVTAGYPAAGGTEGFGGVAGTGGPGAGGSQGTGGSGGNGEGGTTASGGATGVGGSTSRGGTSGSGGSGMGGTHATGGVGGFSTGGAGGLGGGGAGGEGGVGASGGSTNPGTGGQAKRDASAGNIDGGLPSGSITVTALIDGQDLLHILPNGLYWEHVTRAGPGMHNSQTLPTMITSDLVGNVGWCPKWANGCDTCAGSCGELREPSKSEVFPLDVIPGILVSATFTCGGRGSCTLVQVPTREVPEAIIDMDDVAAGGPSTYAATLSFTYVPSPHPG